MLSTAEVGVRPCTIGQYNVNIDAATTLTVPTAAQRAPNSGVLWCVISVEGTAGIRVRWDGVNPTTTVGLLYPAPAAGAPTIITLVGDRMIAAFRIIGAAAGNTMSYSFYQSNERE